MSQGGKGGRKVVANDDLLTKYPAKNKQAVLSEIIVICSTIWRGSFMPDMQLRVAGLLNATESGVKRI